MTDLGVQKKVVETLVAMNTAIINLHFYMMLYSSLY